MENDEIIIAICDDDRKYREYLGGIVHSFINDYCSNIRFIEFHSAEKMFESDELHQIDILFLDIDMPTKDGIEAGKELRMQGVDCNIVFLTSYETYWSVGYELEAHNYLLKTSENIEHQVKNEIRKLIDKIYHDKKSIAVVTRSSTINVLCKNIIYIESRKRQIIYFIKSTDPGKKPEIVSEYCSLDVKEKMIDDIAFCRIHRCYLVNLRFAVGIYDKDIMIDCGIGLPIARGRYEEVRKQFVRYKGEN